MMFERTAMTRKIGFLMPALAFMLITMCSVRVAAANEPPGYIFVAGWYKDLGLQRAHNEAVVPVLREFGYERSVGATPGTAARKKAAGLGAAAMAAAAGVAAGSRSKGAGGPGRSPYNDLAGRGMGAVARSPLASLR